MGASASSTQRHVKPPKDIADFRMLDSPLEQYVIPELPEKRKTTDFKYTVVLAVCIALLFPFLIYTFTQSDLARFVRGFDNCGNVCGKSNPKVDGISCSGEDKTALPILKFTELSNPMDGPFGRIYDKKYSFDCVDSCDTNKNILILNRCIPGLDNAEARAGLEKIASDLNRSAGHIVALCLIGLALSVGMLFLYRYFLTAVVWTVLVGCVLGIILLTIVFWVLYNNNTDVRSERNLLYFAVFFSVISIIIVIVLICMIKRVKLVIRLFKESIKVVFAMPIILFQPLLTLLAHVILMIIFLFFMIIFGTAGNLTKVASDLYEYHPNDLYEYHPNGVMIFTICFHCIICLWMIFFIQGCQHMVISGAVSTYYFARDKSTMTAPIYNGFYNLIKYHLGTVAIGSLIITIVNIIKALLRGLANNSRTRILVECCVDYIESFLKYLTKNAYIMTAMHGQPFFKSGRRAVRLLAANFISTIAINSVGDFVLNMTKVLITLCVIGIGVAMSQSVDIENFSLAIIISAVVTFIIADSFFSVFETTVDTLFLCFCEDRMLNDGMQQPYYMTTDFMQYIEDAKKTVKDPNRPVITV